MRHYRFAPAQSQLNINPHFPKGSLFACPEYNTQAKAYDIEDKQ